MKKMEKYLFDKYKQWADKAIKGKETTNWIIVFEFLATILAKSGWLSPNPALTISLYISSAES